MQGWSQTNEQLSVKSTQILVPSFSTHSKADVGGYCLSFSMLGCHLGYLIALWSSKIQADLWFILSWRLWVPGWIAWEGCQVGIPSRALGNKFFKIPKDRVHGVRLEVMSKLRSRAHRHDWSWVWLGMMKAVLVTSIRNIKNKSLFLQGRQGESYVWSEPLESAEQGGTGKVWDGEVCL